ncbi:uncharacterized protein LOC128895800 [Hylaeus anthracinus]|uniref:uncharacterized protein LOC128895800 n=1 Tax=Hylaeus anthracinus TaxID=313031 RepID=UPI0023B99F5F|nr:uncharacterized protein LOC128895800 [Hylaeus anthracinus]
MNIEGKVALVTGGANGIGFSTARELLRKKAKAVALLDLADSGGESAAANLIEEFGKDRATFIVCDVSKNEQLEEAFKKVIDTYETLDVVVNNAGIMDDADWDVMVDINYKGVVQGTILGLHSMGKYKGGNGGAIVNMSSVCGIDGILLAPIYGGTMHAIVGLTRSLKHFYEKTGIRMLTICPGLTTTTMASKFMSSKEYAMDLLDEEMAAFAMTNLKKQPPEHVANAIIELIEKGENGAIFVVENNEPPYAIELPNYTTLKTTTMDNIKNKIILITGAASGLGYCFAQKLLENGAKTIAILDLPTSPGQTSATTLEKEYGKGKATFFPCDVSVTKDFEEAFKKVVSIFNGIDVVINNAGMYNELNWERTVRVNIGGVIHGTLLAMDHMSKHKGGKGGTVVNISSVAGYTPVGVSPVYCCTKYGVMAFSRSLLENYDKTDVRLMVVCPGLTDTNILDSMLTTSLDLIDFPKYLDQLRDHKSQTVDNVGRAMVSIIQKGKNGSVWVSEFEEPPYAIEFPPVEKVELGLDIETVFLWFTYPLVLTVSTRTDDTAVANITMDNIKNKTALITGGASGLGFVYADKLLQNGAKIVAILDLSTSPGQTSAATLEKKHGKGKAIFLPCDVTNAQQFEQSFKKVVDIVKNIDIVINNAGMIDDTKWEQTVRLNLTSVIQGSILTLNHMNKRNGGKGGVLVNIASIVGFRIVPELPVYCATKHAIVALSRCLEDFYDTTGIRVLTMCPGATVTPLIKELEKKVLDIVDDRIDKLLKLLLTQPTEHVGEAMVNLIQKGENGAFWVSEEGQPPYALEFQPPKRVEVNL